MRPIVLDSNNVATVTNTGQKQLAHHTRIRSDPSSDHVRTGPGSGPIRTEHFGPTREGELMTKDDQPGSTLPRRQLGRAFRDAREGAGLTLEHTAQLMEMGKTSLGRIEKGQNERYRGARRAVRTARRACGGAESPCAADGYEILVAGVAAFDAPGVQHLPGAGGRCITLVVLPTVDGARFVADQ